MKITQIIYEQKKNLGDYQSRTVSLTGVVDENESDADAINGIARQTAWFLNKPEREIEYAKQQKLLTSDDEKVKSYAERYVERYEAQLKEIEG